MLYGSQRDGAVNRQSFRVTCSAEERRIPPEGAVTFSGSSSTKEVRKEKTEEMSHIRAAWSWREEP